MQQQEIILINSRDRLSGTDSDFIYEIKPRRNDFDRIVVLSAHIPKSYYLVQEPYNTFVLEEDGKSVTITVRPGNYSRRSFQSELGSLLNANSPDNYTYAISYPDASSEPDTGKYTYTVTNNATQPKFIFTDGLYEQFGFSRNTAVSFVANTVTSTNVLKFQVEDTLFLYSDMVGGENKTNILQEFFAANQTNFSNISFTCPDPDRYSRRILNLAKTQYDFKLLNEDGQIMNLNGSNIVMTIQLFKSPPTVEESVRAVFQPFLDSQMKPK